MIARTKLSDRCLPAYSRGEEMMNMITHALGGLLGIAVLAMCVIRAVQNHNIYGIAASAVYGAAMICYIGMGWAVIPFAKQTRVALTEPGFYLLLAGGIAYTIGAVLYGIGSKKKWMHSIFHIFVVLGALLQFLSIFLYAL